jgi:hypothetical protein
MENLQDGLAGIKGKWIISLDTIRLCEYGIRDSNPFSSNHACLFTTLEVL